MKVGSYHPIDIKRLTSVKIYVQRLLDDIEIHKAGVSKSVFFDPEFWKNNVDVYNYISNNTFPTDEPIYDMWVKHYDSKYKVAGSDGGFLGLHQDFIYQRPTNTQGLRDDLSIDDQYLLITNSIILDVSPDLSGGQLVIAGDSFEVTKVENRLTDSRDLMHRLKVVDAKKTGDVTVWNGYTVHGVAEITNGWRTALMVVKRVPYDDKYFKV